MSFDISLAREFEYDFERAIFYGINRAGRAFPMTGVWVTGLITKEGPKYIDQLHQEYIGFLEKIPGITTSPTSETMRKNIYYMREAHLLEPISTNEARELGLAVEGDRTDLELDTDDPESLPNVARKFHRVHPGVDTEWVAIEPERLVNDQALIDIRAREFREIFRVLHGVLAEDDVSEEVLNEVEEIRREG